MIHSNTQNSSAYMNISSLRDRSQWDKKNGKNRSSQEARSNKSFSLDQNVNNSPLLSQTQANDSNTNELKAAK